MNEEFNPKEQFGIRIQHAGIHVRNFERTFKWYHEIFGFELRDESGKRGKNPFKGGVFPKMNWIKLDNFYLEVYEVQDAKPFSLVDFEWTLGVKHLNFSVKDIRGFVEFIKKRDDVPILVDNTYSETSGAVYITDPDGILVEVNAEE